MQTLDVSLKTWAHENIPDESLFIQDYQLFRNDWSREGKRGGWGGCESQYAGQREEQTKRKSILTVCVFNVVLNDSQAQFQLWLVGALYHPPWTHYKTVQQITLHVIRMSYPQTGLSPKTPIQTWNKWTKIRPERTPILYLIITNLKNHYNTSLYWKRSSRQSHRPVN